MEKIIAVFVFVLSVSTLTHANEMYVACLESSDAKKAVMLEFALDLKGKEGGYVRYKNGNVRIQIEKTSEVEVQRFSGGRPSVFETRWQEVSENGAGKTFIVTSQGARIYGFKYIRKEDGRMVEFREKDEAAGENGCEWVKKTK